MRRRGQKAPLLGLPQHLGDGREKIGISRQHRTAFEDLAPLAHCANQATSLAYASDSNATLISAYQVTQLSTAVVLDASGKPVFRAVEPTADQIRAELAKVSA